MSKEYINCAECPRCKPKDTLRNGAKWGICGMGGNIVYLEPWKEKRICGNGYIKHGISSCCIYEKKDAVAGHILNSEVQNRDGER